MGVPVLVGVMLDGLTRYLSTGHVAT